MTITIEVTAAHGARIFHAVCCRGGLTEDAYPTTNDKTDVVLDYVCEHLRHLTRDIEVKEASQTAAAEVEDVTFS